MKVSPISGNLIIFGLFNNVNAGLIDNDLTLQVNKQISQQNCLIQKVNTINVPKNSIDNISRDDLIAQINYLFSLGKYKETETLIDKLINNMEPNEVVYLNEYMWVRKRTDEEIKKEREKRVQEQQSKYDFESQNLSNVINILNKSIATKELLKVADDSFEDLFVFGKANISTKSINFSKVVNKYKELKEALDNGNPLLNEIFLATYALANCAKAKKMGLEYVFCYNKELGSWQNYIIAKNNQKLKNFKYVLGIYYDKYEFVLNREIFKTNK